ncbi:MAG: YceI family protein [Acidobacteria bacterium]|nr:YceI family protein [Acidobacteriota bacterium]
MIIAPAPGNFIRLEVLKTGLMKGKKHIFEFPVFKGVAQRNPNRYEISLDARRIECKDDWLKASDLKKVSEYAVKDMLDAERFPEILYKSESGLLTIRGKSAPVGVAYEEKSRNVFEGTATVDMRLFGLKPPSAALGAVGTDPWMKLSFRITPREA